MRCVLRENARRNDELTPEKSRWGERERTSWKAQWRCFLASSGVFFGGILIFDFSISHDHQLTRSLDTYVRFGVVYCCRNELRCIFYVWFLHLRRWKSSFIGHHWSRCTLAWRPNCVCRNGKSRTVCEEGSWGLRVWVLHFSMVRIPIFFFRSRPLEKTTRRVLWSHSFDLICHLDAWPFKLIPKRSISQVFCASFVFNAWPERCANNRTRRLLEQFIVSTGHLSLHLEDVSFGNECVHIFLEEQGSRVYEPDITPVLNDLLCTILLLLLSYCSLLRLKTLRTWVPRNNRRATRGFIVDTRTKYSTLFSNFVDFMWRWANLVPSWLPCFHRSGFPICGMFCQCTCCISTNCPENPKCLPICAGRLLGYGSPCFLWWQTPLSADLAFCGLKFVDFDFHVSVVLRQIF